MQLQFNALFLPMIWFGLPLLGLEVTGIAFLLAYVIHLRGAGRASCTACRGSAGSGCRSCCWQGM